MYYLIVLAVNMKTDPSGLTSSLSGETPPTTYSQTSRPPTSLQSLPSSIGRKISPILTLQTFYYHTYLRRVSSNISYIHWAGPPECRGETFLGRRVVFVITYYLWTVELSRNIIRLKIKSLMNYLYIFISDDVTAHLIFMFV